MSWKSKPNCSVAAVQSELQRFGAKLMGANVFEPGRSYVPMLSQTHLALDERTYSAVVDALTATMMNSEACLNWLNAQPPDLEQVRRTLNTIAKDGKRAGEIVRSTSSAPMKASVHPDDLANS
jgi:hypothetical protein